MKINLWVIGSAVFAAITAEQDTIMEIMGKDMLDIPAS